MKTFLHIGMSSLPNGHAVGLKQYFESIGWKYIDVNTGVQNLNSQICELANDHKPELTFIQIQNTGISADALKCLKANGSWILNWSGDVRARIPEFYFDYAKNVDLTCFSNMNDVDTLNGLGWPAELLQIGYDPAIYTPDGPKIDNPPDIVFMGNHIGHFPLSNLRRDMVNELKRTYGDRFRAYGNGQPDGNYMGNQPGEATVYRSAKIGINLSHFDYRRYTSDRMLRMLGCGVCVLSHRYQGIEQDFEEVKHIGIWDNIDQLKQRIDYLLSHFGVSERVGSGGHQLALNNHTFFHMGRDIHSLYKKYTDNE